MKFLLRFCTFWRTVVNGGVFPRVMAVYRRMIRWAKSGVLDRAYEDDATRQLGTGQGFTPVVPPKRNRRETWEYDKELYKRRNEVERLFRRIKRFRRIFTRYEKPDRMFSAFISFALILDNLC